METAFRALSKKGNKVKAPIIMPIPISIKGSGWMTSNMATGKCFMLMVIIMRAAGREAKEMDLGSMCSIMALSIEGTF